MKYLFSLFILFATLSAHSQCSEFDNLLKKGDNYLKGSKPNYQEAINAYTAAILACSDRAGEAKQRITRMVNDINKLKENAVTAEKKAAEARDSALVAEKKATEAQKETALERDKAQNALANLEKANADVVKLILENAERDILNLRYEDALQKIKAAASLGALKPEVAKAYLEIAFWYSETGHIRRATALLDSIADFTKNTALTTFLQNIPTDTPAARNRLREAMKEVDASHFRFLFEQKYYPNMVPVEGGKFMMGCTKTLYQDCQNKRSQQEQEVRSFYMARTETTVWQFMLYCFAKGININNFLEPWSDPGDNPVVNISWYDAVGYANWVSRQKEKKEAILIDETESYTVNLFAGYRLPAEVEWEYAAKGGNQINKTIYSGSNDLGSVGWYNKNSGNRRTHSVGKKQANRLGLYDMSGNVWEWCWDNHNFLPHSSESYAIIRGGSWYDDAERCQTDYYLSVNSGYHSKYYGFRLVIVL